MAEVEAADRLTDRIGLGVLTRVVGPDLVDEVLVANWSDREAAAVVAGAGGGVFRTGDDVVFRRRLRGGDAQTR